jgi:hypothetical protein
MDQVASEAARLLQEVAVPYRIEKGIPLPANPSRRGLLHQALAAMEVGDSFLLETMTERNKLGATSKLLGIKVVSRAIGNKQVRVWRIA